MASIGKTDCSKVYAFRDVDHLKRKLTKYNADPSNWKGGCSVEFLFKSCQKGECTFERVDSRLVRKFKAVNVYCYHQNQEGETLKLEEEKQIMPDGSERQRKLKKTMPDGSVEEHNFDFVSETMKPGEEPAAAARRGLKEELRNPDCPEVKPDISDLEIEYLSEEANPPQESTSYKGIQNQFITYKFKTNIPTRLFLEKYMEVEKDPTGDLTTFFIWKKI